MKLELAHNIIWPYMKDSYESRYFHFVTLDYLCMHSVLIKVKIMGNQGIIICVGILMWVMYRAVIALQHYFILVSSTLKSNENA